MVQLQFLTILQTFFKLNQNMYVFHNKYFQLHSGNYALH
jgi:hypothetical protein